MTEGRRGRGKGGAWSEEELKLLRDNIRLTQEEIAELLPERSLCAVKNVFYKMRRELADELAADEERRKAERELARQEHNAEQYAVKEPGEYIETLSAYFMGYPDCVDAWMRWNGYFTYRELCRDMKASPLGIVTLLCQAK